MRYDLAIVGSGGAAFAAAITARGFGASVVMVERDRIGGTCVNTGCVPSKALLAAAETRHAAMAADRFPGLTATLTPLDFTQLIEGKDTLVAAMRTDKYVDLAAEYGWTIVSGTARFVSGPALEVTGDDGRTSMLGADHYVVATGSVPSIPPIRGLSRTGYLTSATAMELDRLPKSMVIIGGNAIGVEQAQLFARLGTQVTIVEALDRLVPFDEPEASEAIEAALTGEGIAVRSGATATEVRRKGQHVTVNMQASDGAAFEVRAEHLLVAAGRRPNTAGLDLESVGVKIGTHGEVVVDEQLRAGNPRIFAAGDVTGHPQYVYVAAKHGSMAAANALRQEGQTVDYRYLPKVTFTSPAVASVGLTEAQAVAEGHRCDCRVLPLEYVPRALVNRDTHGMIKLVTDANTGRVLGIHAVAESAGELVAAGVYVLAAGMTVEQLANLWCPYLTMAEGLKLAAQTFTRDVSKLSCCAA